MIICWDRRGHLALRFSSKSEVFSDIEEILALQNSPLLAEIIYLSSTGSKKTQGDN